MIAEEKAVLTSYFFLLSRRIEIRHSFKKIIIKRSKRSNYLDQHNSLRLRSSPSNPLFRKIGGRVVNAQCKHEIAGVASEPNAV